MTQTRKEIKIFEQQGWRIEKSKLGIERLLTPQKYELWHYDNRGNSYGPCRSWDSALGKGSHYRKHLPRYFTNLDDIRKAFMSLDDWLKLEFGRNLIRVFQQRTGKVYEGASVLCVMHAEARDWAEAFGKTLKLW